MDAASMIPLNPRDYLVLLSLVNEERHGYGIVKEVQRESGGGVRIERYKSISEILIRSCSIESLFLIVTVSSSKV